MENKPIPFMLKHAIPNIDPLSLSVKAAQVIV